MNAGYVTVVLRHPANSVNGSVPLKRTAAIRANYAKVAVKRKEREDAFRACMHVVRGAPQGFVPTGYRIVWYYKGVRPDADNIVARCKHYLDGCALAFGVNDATWEFGGVQRVHDSARGGEVEIVFSDVRCTMDDVRCGNSAPAAREKGGEDD